MGTSHRTACAEPHGWGNSDEVYLGESLCLSTCVVLGNQIWLRGNQCHHAAGHTQTETPTTQMRTQAGLTTPPPSSSSSLLPPRIARQTGSCMPPQSPEAAQQQQNGTQSSRKLNYLAWGNHLHRVGMHQQLVFLSSVPPAALAKHAKKGTKGWRALPKLLNYNGVFFSCGLNHLTYLTNRTEHRKFSATHICCSVTDM